MKSSIDHSSKYFNIVHRKALEYSRIDQEEADLRNDAAEEEKVRGARRRYAASKIGALVRGFLDRVLCRKLLKEYRATQLIQKIMKGKLGRIKWKREYWRSLSIVKSDEALKDIIERSKFIKESITERSRGIREHWIEYFDPYTDSFWYYNKYTKQNTWEVPLCFQKDLVCYWNGFESFGDNSLLVRPCRCVFSNIEEYRNHLRNAHKWYCVACGMKNPGINFPVCSLCNNKYNEDGIDGEKVLMESIANVQKKLNDFLKKDEADRYPTIYNIKHRLIEIAETRKDALQQLEERTGSPKTKTRQKNSINQQYLKTMTDTYHNQILRKTSVIDAMMDFQKSDQRTPYNATSSSTPSLPQIKETTRPTSTSSTRPTSSSSISSKRKISDTQHGSSSTGKFLSTIPEPQDSQFTKRIGYVSAAKKKLEQEKEEQYNQQLDSTLTKKEYFSVTTAMEIKKYNEMGGSKGEKELFKNEIARGIFSDDEFTLLTSIHDDDLKSKLLLSIEEDDEDDSDDDNDNQSKVYLPNGDLAFKSPQEVRSLIQQKPKEDVDKVKLPKLWVCKGYLDHTCSVTTCPLAHPGIRDQAKIKFKSVRNDNGTRTRTPFVHICPEFTLQHPLCSKGMNCPYYHIYVRPTTQDIILKLYPIKLGQKKKEYVDGSRLYGNIVNDEFHGYGTLYWENGSVYMGDWYKGKRQGFGIYRTKIGLEYIGQFQDNKRHGWGILSNYELGEEYIGQWENGKMSGVGILTSANGDVYKGEFKNNYYNGIGFFQRANGDVYLGFCEDGRAHGLGILSLFTGEKYKGFFHRNSRHGRGACSYPNGSKYAGYWYHGVHQGYGIYLSPEGDRYIGEWAAGKKHGKGRYYFINGDFYDGEFHKNFAQGLGVYFFANGNIYTGQWHHDMRNGKGTYVFSNGSKYTGHWLDNKIHVKGRFDFANGAYYRGEFNFNTKHGKGIYTWANGNVYRGEFLSEKMCGHGELQYFMGHRYVGKWDNNKKNGYGIMYFANGSIYEGNWINDIRQGKGKLTLFPNSPVEEYYDGDWHKDQWHGKGKYAYRKMEGTVYEGDWVYGVREGQGTLTYKDGSYYRGEFRKNQMWGKGIYVGADLSQYDGEWRANMRHGIGTSIDSNGSIYHGEFFGNMKQGKGKLFNTDGSIYTGVWDANIIIGNGKVTFQVGNKERRDGLPKEISVKVFGY